MQESDTTTEWSKSEVGELLTIKIVSGASAAATDHEDIPEIDSDTKLALNEVVAEFVGSLGPDQLSSIAGLGEPDSIPNEIDGPLLGQSRGAIGRELDFTERRYLRDQFKKVARSSTPTHL